jgi:NAD(P)-dependent dehydrogenase (short-subunit alcohol dehydrogenase family)
VDHNQVPGQQRPVAVVTGAAGAIGRALDTALGRAGYEVVGLDLPSACPPDGRLVPCDITDDAQVRATMRAVQDRTGRIDLLVNNAGISAIGGFDDHDVATHQQVLAVNYLGAVSCTQAALPALRAARGHVVVISSVAGFAPVVGRPAYVAAKHAVTGLFESLRPELARDGVGVTVVHPTFLTTHLGTAPGAERTTTGSAVTADDVADAVLEAVGKRRPRALVGRTAHLAWHVHRLAPGLYERLMTRRMSTGGPRG